MEEKPAWMQRVNWRARYWVFLLPLAAVLLFLLLKALAPGPAFDESGQAGVLVETEVIAERQVVPVISGFGRVKPKASWSAISEVTGRIIYRHPNLERGKQLAKDTVLLKIDPVDYQLKLAQARSNLASAEAEKQGIELQIQQSENTLAIERERLDLQRKEFARKEKLGKQGSLSRSTLEAERSKLLQQEQKVQELTTKVSQAPNDLAVSEARIEVSRSQVEEAQRLLEKTEIVLPFDARIAEVNAEREQVINSRDMLVQAYQIGKLEIPAQFSMSDMREFAAHMPLDSLPARKGVPDIGQLQLDADIRLYLSDNTYRWQGKVTGVGESIDVQGNSLTLIIETEQDWDKIPLRTQPPLMNDMFVEVNVQGMPVSAITVPARVLSGKEVFVAEQGVLRRREVKTSLTTSEGIIVDAGLQAGESLIVSAVYPAVDGMPVRIAE